MDVAPGCRGCRRHMSRSTGRETIGVLTRRSSKMSDAIPPKRPPTCPLTHQEERYVDLVIKHYSTPPNGIGKQVVPPVKPSATSVSKLLPTSSLRRTANAARCALHQSREFLEYNPVVATLIAVTMIVLL